MRVADLIVRDDLEVVVLCMHVYEAVQITSVCVYGLVNLVVRRLVFFFQAEDGIRDVAVTGVQTCALPIFPAPGTELLQLQSVRLGFAVLRSRIIPLFAITALHCNDLSGHTKPAPSFLALKTDRKSVV